MDADDLPPEPGPDDKIEKSCRCAWLQKSGRWLVRCDQHPEGHPHGPHADDDTPPEARRRSRR